MSVESKIGKYFHLYDGERIRSIIYYQSHDVMLSLPQDPANMDYQAYLAWVAEGNTADEWKPDTTPEQVTAEESVIDESAVNDAE